jgi:glycosyltransferase involved in cell wall biosynthesis
VVSLLAEGLVEAGHDVTLFASGDSRTTAKLVSVFPKAPSERKGETLVELRHALSCYELAHEFDVISDHSGSPGAALAGAVGTPAVHTVHLALDGETGSIYEQIARLVPQLGLISLSGSQRRALPDLPWIGNCPNAIDLDAHPLCTERGDYLAFVGRMSPDKGADRAIQVARAAGLPLRIAAKMRQPDEIEYFQTHVRPQLDEQIEYLGELEQRDKVELLQHARATLFPIEWEEPFGLVMIESMACGTPVIATRRGSVPEVIEHGRGGIIVDDAHEMADALAAADELDPRECRRSVEERFSPQQMTQNYLDVYKRALASQATTLIGTAASQRPLTSARR